MTDRPKREAREIDTLLERCRSGGDGALEAMRELVEAGGQRAVPAILPLAISEDESIREAAARALGELGDDHLDQVGPVLETLLDDREWLVRDAAAESLGFLRHGPARAALERVLRHDEEWVVRASAAWALGELGDANALAALAAALADAVDPVRAYVANAIGQLGDAKQLPVVQDRLTIESHPHPRANLLAVALRFGDEPAFDDLLELVVSVDEDFVLQVFGVIEDLLSEKTPPVVVRRAAELEKRVAELVHRTGGDDAYTAALRSRLIDLARSAPGDEK